MTIYRNHLTSGVSGSSILVANAGDPDAFDVVDSAGGNPVRSTAPGTSHIPMWMLVNPSSAASSDVGFTSKLTPSHAKCIHGYLHVANLADIASGPIRIGALASATPTVYLDVLVKANGHFDIANNVGTSMWGGGGSASAISAATDYMWEAWLDNSAAAGSHVWGLNVYTLGPKTLVPGLSGGGSAGSTGTGNMASAWWGQKFAPVAGAGSKIYIGDPAVNDSGITEVGEYVGTGSYTGTGAAVYVWNDVSNLWVSA